MTTVAYASVDTSGFSLKILMSSLTVKIDFFCLSSPGISCPNQGKY